MRGSFAFLGVFLVVVAVQAQPVYSSDRLPPVGGRYDLTGSPVIFPGGIMVDSFSLTNFTANFPPPAVGTVPIAFGADAHGHFSGAFTSFFDVFVADDTWLVTFNHQTGSTRFFDVEMISMTLVGGTLPPGVIARESTSQHSVGQTTIQDVGGGLYHIDSFFDVFTELSLDGGATFLPAQNTMHITGSPEPASLLALTAGLAGFLVRRRRR